MRLVKTFLLFQVLLVLLGSGNSVLAQKSLTTRTKVRQPMLPDSLAQRVERAYFVLSRINGTAHRATNTEALSDDLPTVEDNLETIRQNFD